MKEQWIFFLTAPFTDQAQLVFLLLHYYRCAGWRSMVVCLLEISDNRKRLNSALWNTSNLSKGLIYLIYLLCTMESENDRVSQAITRLRRELPHRVPRLWGTIPATWNSRKHFKLLTPAWSGEQYYYESQNLYATIQVAYKTELMAYKWQTYQSAVLLDMYLYLAVDQEK